MAPSLRSRPARAGLRYSRRLLVALTAFALLGCDRTPTGPRTGNLTLTISGLSGHPAGIVVTGAEGFSQVVSATATLRDLKPGIYSVTVPEVTIGTDIYEPPFASRSVEIDAGDEAALSITFVLAPGTLIVLFEGLPDGLAPSLELSGAGVVLTVTGADTITDLAPGQYRLAPRPVEARGARYTPSSSGSNVVVRSRVVSAANIRYDVLRGSLVIATPGLPAGTFANLVVTGPGGFSKSIQSRDTITFLVPGTYTVTGATVPVGVNRYRPATSTVDAVVKSEQLTIAPLSYSVEPGLLTVSISGLPNGVAAAISVVGTPAFARTLAASTSLEMPPGVYAVTAQSVTSATGFEFAPAPTARQLTVTSGSTAAFSFEYATTNGPNFRIDRAYVVQAAQDPNAPVPVIAGKAALVRVFAIANRPGLQRPPARLTVYNGATTVATFTTVGAGGFVPTSFTEHEYNSWDFRLDGSLVRPGMRLLAEVNPTRSSVEANYDDNSWPTPGAAPAMQILDLPPVHLTFVPLRDGGGRLGEVNTGNVERFVEVARDLLPATFVTRVRQPLQVTPFALTSSSDWGQALTELAMAGWLDGNTEHYYGVARFTTGPQQAGAGFLGLPYAGGPDFSFNWQLAGSMGEVAYVPMVVAHEIGHNWGRLHAPCGDPHFLDSQYPFPDGSTGVYGWRAANSRLLTPDTKDFMSYCWPGWASAYNYSAMVAFRLANPPLVAAFQSERAVLVWGEVNAEGNIHLYPAFDVGKRRIAAPARGPFTARLSATDGRSLLQVSFDAAPIDHAADRRVFAFAVSLAEGDDLARIEVIAPDGRRASLRGQAALRSTSSPAPSLTRLGADRARLIWDASESDRAIVLDERSGEVVAFVRGGSANLWTTATSLRMLLSDGIRTRSVVLR